MTDERCGLCGHLPSDPGHRMDKHAASETRNDVTVQLCHEDDHSCYHRWVRGERPVADSDDPTDRPRCSKKNPHTAHGAFGGNQMQFYCPGVPPYEIKASIGALECPRCGDPYTDHNAACTFPGEYSAAEIAKMDAFAAEQDAERPLVDFQSPNDRSGLVASPQVDTSPEPELIHELCGVDCRLPVRHRGGHIFSVDALALEVADLRAQLAGQIAATKAEALIEAAEEINRVRTHGYEDVRASAPGNKHFEDWLRARAKRESDAS